jgi:site-specific DNA-methyltransferase (adenine-specific)/adenine-specific DNA-methyltransferase
VATDKDSLVLDSFVGSGTTGHAVLDLNKSDGGKRRFILVEMDEAVCQNVAAQRLKRAVDGYERANGEKTHKVEPLGGGFRFCKLGKSLFDETGNIAESVNFAELAAHVFFTETGVPIPQRATGKTPWLGVHEGKAVYLLFNGVLGDKKPNGGNVLTSKVLANLREHTGLKIIYGEGCLLSQQRLKREGIVFKQVPYEIKVS